MSSTEERLIEGTLTGIIIKLFFRVYDRLGFGFLEAVYREALAFEFTREGIAFVREAPVEVWYCGTKLGYYRADPAVVSGSARASTGSVRAKWQFPL